MASGRNGLYTVLLVVAGVITVALMASEFITAEGLSMSAKEPVTDAAIFSTHRPAGSALATFAIG